MLNGEVLQQIAGNGNNRNLVIAFSAGNKDALQAMTALSLVNANLNNKVDIMSVGSPIGLKELQSKASKVNVGMIGQYNDWRDPVTHPKSWGVGVIGVGLVGGALIYQGMSSLGLANLTNASGTGIEAFANLAVKTATTVAPAAGAAGAATKRNLGLFHTFPAYLENNVNGVMDKIQQWHVENPATSSPSQ